MQAFTADDGCPAFRATAMLDDGQIGRTFRWSVIVDTPTQTSVSGIPTEVNDAASTDRYRVFTLARADQTERYYLTHCRRLGANKLFVPGAAAPAVRFAVWAPNAKNVELVRSRLSGENNDKGGYICDDGRGVSGGDSDAPRCREACGAPNSRTRPTSPTSSRATTRSTCSASRRTTVRSAYRTDLYSRCQIGSGRVDPARDRGLERPTAGSRRHQELLGGRRSRAGDGGVQLAGDFPRPTG